MNGLFNEIIIGIIGAVVGGLIGYLASVYKIKYEYKRRLIHERTKDFLDDLKNYYQPWGYYSSLLAYSSLVLSSALIQGKINDFLIKKMLFDLGNYFHTFLDLSENRGYATFPNYKRKFEIFEYHMGILSAFGNLIPDPMAIPILRNISIKCNNNLEEFCNEVDKSEILKKLKDKLTELKDKLTEDSLNEIAINGAKMNKTIEESIDSALEPWYITYSHESKVAYEDRERIRKEFDKKIRAMLSPEKSDEGEKRSEDEKGREGL